MDDLISRAALLEFAHNHVNGTVDCNDIARFPAVDAEPVITGETSDGYHTFNDWNMFACRELERAPEWDGHTPVQAIERIGRLVPVRHGKWSKGRKIGDVWCCSECGFGQLVSASFMYKEGCIGHSDNRTRFCPNCGARMDAEENT